MSKQLQSFGQPVADPLAYFRNIPWCATLLSDKSVLHIAVPDRNPIVSGESALVRVTLNTPDTVKACITCFRKAPKGSPEKDEKGLAPGEDKANPFLEIFALIELGQGVNGFANTAHGGIFGVVLDEVMGTAANHQAENGAYTAYLNVKFIKPMYTPCVMVCRGRVVKKEGKKLFLRGSFENKDGVVLAEADGLWIMMPNNVGREKIGKTKL